MPEAAYSKTLIVIAGPTAVGKTAVAVRVARRFHAEIISADSRQIFRELEIGTAKPTKAELAEAPHHFINSHSIHDEYDASTYGIEALAVVNRLLEKRDYAVLCGGSGLYIKAVLEGFDDIPQVAPAIREQITSGYREHGIAWLQQQMQLHDPQHFKTLDQKNPQRLIRALEVKIGTGLSIRDFQRQKTGRELPFRVVKVGLELPREELYRRIDHRMDVMIEQGLFQEAQQFFAVRHLNALQTVGYREIFDFMEGKYDRGEAIRLLKRNSRHYAKRQLTWFRKDPDIHWFSPADTAGIMAFIGSTSTPS